MHITALTGTFLLQDKQLLSSKNSVLQCLHFRALFLTTSLQYGHFLFSILLTNASQNLHLIALIGISLLQEGHFFKSKIL